MEYRNIPAARREAIRSRAGRAAAHPAVNTDTLLDYSVLNLLIRTVRAGVRLIRTRVIEPYRRHRRLKLAVRDLRAMSDHQLKDIGLHRGQIYAAAYGKLEKPRPRQKQAKPLLLPPPRRTRSSRRENVKTATPTAERLTMHEIA